MFDIKKIRERAKKLLGTKEKDSKQSAIESRIEEMAQKHETRISESVSTENIYKGQVLPTEKTTKRYKKISKDIETMRVSKGIAFPVISPHLPKILALLEEDPDYTLEELGERCGVTRERIRQILKRHSIPKSNGRRDRLRKQDYGRVHIENNNVQSSYIGSDSGIEETDILNFFDEKHEKFLGVSPERIETVTVYIVIAPKSGKYIRKRRSARYCQPDHPLLCFKNPKRGQNWRCYVCKPLYEWDYINKDGVILKKEKTQPCGNCGKDVTHRAAILWRQENDERYKGHFYCNRECFYTFRNKMRWWESSPIYQGRFWKERESITRTCVICNKEFQTKHSVALTCSKECKRERVTRLSQEKRKENLKKSTHNIVKELHNLGVETKEIANYLECETATVYSWRYGSHPSPKNITRLKRLLEVAKNLTT